MKPCAAWCSATRCDTVGDTEGFDWRVLLQAPLALYLADYASDSDGTGIVHSAPGLRPGRLQQLCSPRLKYADILNPVQGNGSYTEELPLFGGRTSGRPARASSRCWARATA